MASSKPIPAGRWPGPMQRSPRRARDLIRTAIMLGAFGPNQRLDESFLVSELRISRNAIREGLQMLALEGVVTRERRVGTMVTGRQLRVDLPTGDLPTPVPGLTLRQIDARTVPTSVLAGARVSGELVRIRLLEHLYVADGEPIGVRLAYTTERLTAHGSRPGAPGLDDAFLVVARREVLTSVMPFDRVTAQILQVGPGASALVEQQVSYNATGIPIEVTYSHFRADRVVFRFDTEIGDPNEEGPTLKQENSVLKRLLAEAELEKARLRHAPRPET